MSASQACSGQFSFPTVCPSYLCASASDPPAPAGRPGPVTDGMTTLFSCVLLHTRSPVCPQRVEFLFPQACESPAVRSLWPSKSDSLRTPPLVAQPAGWEGCCEAQHFPSSGRENLCGAVVFHCVCHPVSGHGTRLYHGCTSHHLALASPLSLDVEYLFW